MAKEYTTSTNKYLDLNGLSYYDGKLKTWVGGQFTTKLADYYTKDAADAQFAPLADFNAHIEAFTNWKATNDADVKYSKDLWTAFLKDYDDTTGTAAPTLQEIKTFIYTTVPTTYAVKTDVDTAIADLAKVYVSKTDFANDKTTLEGLISAAQAKADANEGLITALTTTVGNNYTDLDGKITALTTTVGNNYTDLDGKITTLDGKVEGYNTTLTGLINGVDDKTKANAQEIETLKNGLSGAVHFIGVYDKLPDTANNGDIAIVGGAEYVYVVSGEGESATATWEKLGDTTTEMGAITDLTNALNDYKTSNDAKVAAVEKKIDDYVTANDGVVAGISGRVTANEGAISTLQTNVEALQNVQGDYVKAADFITMSEIDALFA